MPPTAPAASAARLTGKSAMRHPAVVNRLGRGSRQVKQSAGAAAYVVKPAAVLEIQNVDSGGAILYFQVIDFWPMTWPRIADAC